MDQRLLDILVSRNTITPKEAEKILRESEKNNISLETLLQKKGINEVDLVKAKSELSGYPFKNLEGITVPYNILGTIPEASAKYYSMVPIGKSDNYLEVGVLNPEDLDTQEALKFISAQYGMPIKVFVITPTDFKRIIGEYKGLSGEVTKALGEFKQEYQKQFKPKRKLQKPNIIVQEAPISRIVGVIIRHAVEGGASDIHIEPLRNKTRVRFRVDGILHTSITVPSSVHAAIVARIKIMSNLKIDETRIPQDGRFHARIAGRGIDFRVSIFPTVFGEKVVIRILDPKGNVGRLTDLGLEGRNLKEIEEKIKRPYGMILITGPTGSGKSTTLYAILQILNQERTNIVSLEDPVEYYIEGVNQSQIRPEINYSFATGLRSILRQDPDVIMVGEIRDKETAAMAIHAALTGHLVLSTLHTNTAIGVIPRLIDMGVEPYLIPNALLLAVGQRLARRLCPGSRKKVPITGRVEEIIKSEIEKMPDNLRAEIEQNMPTEIYEPEVSPMCPKGTRGRIGVFEILAMTPELEKIVLNEPTENKILAEARRQGMITMRQDGILKVLKGVIGLEQLLEVT